MTKCAVGERFMRTTMAGVVAILTLLFSPTDGRSQVVERRLTVDGAVELALRQNARVIVAAAEVDRARGAVEETQSRALPDLDFSYAYGRNLQRPAIFFNQGGQTQQITVGEAHDNTFVLSLRQTLFDPSLPSAIRAAGEAEGLARAVDADARVAVAYATKVAYYQALLDEQLVRVQEEALRQADARLQQLRERAMVGLASAFDSLTARVARENIRPSLIEAQHAQDRSLARLKRVIGIALDTDLTLADSLSDVDVDVPRVGAVDSVVSVRPDVQAAERTVALRRAALAVEQRSSWPTLRLSAGLQRRASSPEFRPRDQDFVQSFVVGGELSWPLFDGRATTGRALQAAAQLRQASANLEAARSDARLEIEEAAQDIDAARALVEAARATIGQAEQALAIAQQRFVSGLSTQLELWDAELQLTRARTNVALALFRFSVARAGWTAAVGSTR